MTIFFTSDIHFGHAALLHPDMPYFFHHRKYSSIDEMDEGIIDKWNSQVTPQDTVYIIGDLSFRTTEKTVEILSRIKGQKFLIKGNHDHEKKMKAEYKAKFQAIHKYHELRVGIDGEKQLICLFHFPIMHWHRQHYGSWHLHGHLHGSPSGIEGKILDVGWDNHGKLLSLEDVNEYMKTKRVRNNHHSGDM